MARKIFVPQAVLTNANVTGFLHLVKAVGERLITGGAWHREGQGKRRTGGGGYVVLITSDINSRTGF